VLLSTPLMITFGCDENALSEDDAHTLIANALNEGVFITCFSQLMIGRQQKHLPMTSRQ
jgi:hypothetical protein